MKPISVEEVGYAIRESASLHIVGSGSKAAFEMPFTADEALDMSGLTGVIAYEPDDRFIEVFAGTTVAEIQEITKAKGQCIALPDPSEQGDLIAGLPGTVGGLISTNLPHALNAQCGGPREWVLGLTAVRSNGDVVHCGGRVVKSVAGFNVHRLFTGTRGTIGVIVSAVLRVYPIPAVPQPEAVTVKAWSKDDPLVIQRVLPTDWHQAKAVVEEMLFAYDQASSTLWYAPCAEQAVERFDGDWIMGANRGKDNLAEFTDDERKLMAMTQSQLDPYNKLNPGAFGCV